MIYQGSETERFVLGEAGTNTLGIFGINPSTADDCLPDPTVRRIKKLSEAWGFDGFLIFNLYPYRTSKPEQLPKLRDAGLANRNAKIIRERLKERNVSAMWAAWGNAFDLRNYFTDCLKEILSETQGLGLQWNKCESLTKAKNPRHPLSGRPHTITETSHLECFDVEAYLQDKHLKGKSSAK
jgi:hypothetical protein